MKNKCECRPKVFDACVDCGKPKNLNTRPRCYDCKPIKQYTQCTRCGIDKSSNKSPYCNLCMKIYATLYRQKRGVSSKSKKLQEIKERIGKFVSRVEADKQYIDLYDISTIIDLYHEITTREYEFDTLPAGTQVVKMYEKIKKFVS